MSPQRSGGRRQADYHHERPADPAEASDRPLEDKAAGKPGTEPGHEPGGAGAPGEDRDPHAALNHPVDELDPDSDSDPYADAEAKEAEAEREEPE